VAVYGITLYGTETYGYFIPPIYRVDPFIATPTSYTQISITWTKPSGTILGYRLIKNMYGAPVDQDDGQILIDTTAGWPGGNYVDTNVTPGAYHYYGMYLLINSETDEWVRAGLCGCLMVSDYNSAQSMEDLIPNFYINAINGQNELVVDPVGNTYLDKFIEVCGWGFDYLRTQYDTYTKVNDPWTVPLNDLYNMAGQFNININPDIHPYTLRKAIYYNANVNQLRGTPSGIATELSALTGWNADITAGPNMMLNNDQSYFADPFYEAWSGSITYSINERVSYGNYFYQCISTANYGNAPTGTSSSNTWWEAVLNSSDNTVLYNSVTGWPNTWEILYPDLSNAQPAASSLYESIGTSDPLDTSDYAFNSLTGKNLHGSSTDIYLRSLSRTTVDMETVTTNFAPDKYQAIADGIPIPFIGFNQAWSATTRYEPQDIVTYNNQPFIALRASLNSVPPYASAGSSNQDWAPLSFDDRFRVCVSAYVTASSSVTVYPFVEWYDAGGNFIERVIARNPVGGSVEIPNQLAFDSFTVGAGGTLSARETNDGGNTWAQETGSWSVSPFGQSGCAYPTTTGQRSIAVVNTGNANAQVGLTFVTAPESGQSTGLILRYSDNSDYLRADMSTLKVCSAGVLSTLGTYSTACNVGDRLLVTLNGTTITVYRNNAQVLQISSSFNQTSTYFGIINENS
jgi:hypothetical protein